MATSNSAVDRRQKKERGPSFFVHAVFTGTSCVQGTLLSVVENSKMMGGVAGQRRQVKYANRQIPGEDDKGLLETSC